MFKRLMNLIRGRDDELEDVNAFHRKFGMLSFDEPGHLTAEKMRERIDFLHEELNELADAAQTNDMDKMVDALVDLVYVAKGTADMLGLRNVWRRSWADVQRANMSKVRGVTHRGNAVDVKKPDGWIAPYHVPFLLDAGYDHTRWFGPHLRFLEDNARRDGECTDCRGGCSSCDPLFDIRSAS